MESVDVESVVRLQLIAGTGDEFKLVGWHTKDSEDGYEKF